MPKAIKESSTKKEVNSYLTGDHGDIVTIDGTRVATNDQRIQKITKRTI